MPKINCLVIVLGYSYHLTQSYKHYLDMALTAIKDNGAEIVITTGSYEGNRADYTDEAEFIADYLHSHRITAEIFTDPLGITTLQNLRNAKKMMKEKGIEAKKIVICCEGVRRFKVRILSTLLYKKLLKIKDWEMIEDRNDKLYEKYWNTPRDILGYFLPFIEKRKAKKRQQKRGAL